MEQLLQTQFYSTNEESSQNNRSQQGWSCSEDRGRGRGYGQGQGHGQGSINFEEEKSQQEVMAKATQDQWTEMWPLEMNPCWKWKEGNILIPLKNGEHQFISNVYYVPNMKSNI